MKPKFSKKVFGTIIEKKLAKPECFGKYLGERIGNRSVVELCCCIGIQLIQVSRQTSKKVIGVDINKSLIIKARKNAKVYGAKNTSFIVGDALDENLLKTLSSEVVIMDPHWSATRTLQRDFAKKVNETTPPIDKMVFLVRKRITDNIIAQVPPSIPDEELLKLGNCEIQDVYVNGKYHSRIAYYGDLNKTRKSRVDFEYQKDTIPEKSRTKLVTK